MQDQQGSTSWLVSQAETGTTLGNKLFFRAEIGAATVHGKMRTLKN